MDIDGDGDVGENTVVADAEAAATTEKQWRLLEGKTGRGSSYKKRHFRLGKDTLTYCASAKQDTKVLGVIHLSGGSARTDAADIVVVDGGGRSFELRSKTAAEAEKWVTAIQNNVDMSTEAYANLE